MGLCQNIGFMHLCILTWGWQSGRGDFLETGEFWASTNCTADSLQCDRVPAWQFCG